MTPILSQNQMSEFKETKKMKVVQLTIWVNPKIVFELYPNLKNSPLGPQKVKNNPKIKYKTNIRIDGNIQNENCSTTSVDHKTVFELFLNPKISPLGAQKVKNNPKIKSKLKVRIKRKKENESCLTTWADPKTVV